MSHTVITYHLHLLFTCDWDHRLQKTCFYSVWKTPKASASPMDRTRPENISSSTPETQKPICVVVVLWTGGSAWRIRVKGPAAYCTQRRHLALRWPSYCKPRVSPPGWSKVVTTVLTADNSFSLLKWARSFLYAFCTLCMYDLLAFIMVPSTTPYTWYATLSFVNNTLNKSSVIPWNMSSSVPSIMNHIYLFLTGHRTKYILFNIFLAEEIIPCGCASLNRTSYNGLLYNVKKFDWKRN